MEKMLGRIGKIMFGGKEISNVKEVKVSYSVEPVAADALPGSAALTTPEYNSIDIEDTDIAGATSRHDGVYTHSFAKILNSAQVPYLSYDTTTTKTPAYPRTTTTSGAPVKRTNTLTPGATYYSRYGIMLENTTERHDLIEFDVVAIVNSRGELDYVRVSHGDDETDSGSQVTGSSHDKELVQDQMVKIAMLQSAMLQAKDAMDAGDFDAAKAILSGKQGPCRNESCE